MITNDDIDVYVKTHATIIEYADNNNNTCNTTVQYFSNEKYDNDDNLTHLHKISMKDNECVSNYIGKNITGYYNVCFHFPINKLKIICDAHKKNNFLRSYDDKFIINIEYVEKRINDMSVMCKLFFLSFCMLVIATSLFVLLFIQNITHAWKS
jgi:hypothetical protein